MDHAEAHERIADLALEPGQLEAALASAAPADRALSEHIAGCGTCRAELDEWRAVHGRLAAALQTDRPGGRLDVDPIEPDAALRARVLGLARQTGPIVVARRPSRLAFLDSARWSPVMGLAAALIVAIAGTFLLAGPGMNVIHQVDEARALSEVVASVDRIMDDPGHSVATLKTTAGQAGGSVMWASRDLVVLTSAIASPEQGRTYRCWLEAAGGETAIGEMEWAGSTAYWVGSLDEWASISLEPGVRFVVSLEPADGSTTRTGSVVLEADL